MDQNEGALSSTLPPVTHSGSSEQPAPRTHVPMQKIATSPCVAQLLSVPTCVTLLCALTTTPPSWLRVSKPQPVVAAIPAPALPSAPRKEIPRLLAVDARIAKRVNALRPGVKRRLAQVMRRLPTRVTLLVTSAARTRAEQAHLRPTFGIKARPGTSAHEDGRAIDLNVMVDGERVSPKLNNKIIGPLMASEGFVYLGRRDPVHYSLPKADLSPADYSPEAHGPALDVMSMDEVRSIQEEEARTSTFGVQQASVPTAVLTP